LVCEGQVKKDDVVVTLDLRVAKWRKHFIVSSKTLRMFSKILSVFVSKLSNVLQLCVVIRHTNFKLQAGSCERRQNDNRSHKHAKHDMQCNSIIR